MNKSYKLNILISMFGLIIAESFVNISYVKYTITYINNIIHNRNQREQLTYIRLLWGWGRRFFLRFLKSLGEGVKIKWHEELWKYSLKVNKLRYITLFVISGSMKKLFSVDYVNINLFFRYLFNTFCPVRKELLWNTYIVIH